MVSFVDRWTVFGPEMDAMDPPKPPLRFAVTTITGQTFALEMHGSATIGDVKQVIEERDWIAAVRKFPKIAQ